MTLDWREDGRLEAIAIRLEAIASLLPPSVKRGAEQSQVKSVKLFVAACCKASPVSHLYKAMVSVCLHLR